MLTKEFGLEVSPYFSLQSTVHRGSLMPVSVVVFLMATLPIAGMSHQPVGCVQLSLSH